MTNLEIAIEAFNGRNREIWNMMLNNVGNEAEINARYNYKHGWVSVNGESFDSDILPGAHQPYSD